MNIIIICFRFFFYLFQKYVREIELIEVNKNHTILLQKELLQLVTMNRPEQVYQTDDIAHASGHLVLRLPVRHCELNPIELIQGKSVMFSFISGFFYHFY